LTETFRLIPCEEDGFPSDLGLSLPEFARSACEMSAVWYPRVGYVPPWIGYLSIIEGSVVGGGGFKEPPQDGRVEIAYFTAPEFEGRGHATQTARALIAIAQQADPALLIAAQTLPEENASTTILRKLGFRLHGSVQHPEDGEIWEWRFEDSN
jgi:RimJ/RimL family protein N-acetyltransferase